MPKVKIDKLKIRLKGISTSRAFEIADRIGPELVTCLARRELFMGKAGNTNITVKEIGLDIIPVNAQSSDTVISTTIARALTDKIITGTNIGSNNDR